MELEKAKEAVSRVVEPFLKQGERYVFVALCCDRMYVSPVAAQKCRTCQAIPENHKIRTSKDVTEPSEAFLKLLTAVEEKSQFGVPPA